jgi:hypothetical protein
MLIGGSAVTGAAYVAPQILSTAVAGAQTATVYVFKYTSAGCVTTGISAGPNDADCDMAFSNTLQADVAGEGTVNISCPPAGFATSNVGVTAGEVTAGATCMVVFAGVSTNQGTCYTTGHRDDIVLIDADMKGACYVLPEGETFSAFTIALRCDGSP